jgi:putative ABC transport system substrate-binding protein
MIISEPLYISTLLEPLITGITVASMPATYASREYVDAGGLMAYGPNLTAMWRPAAVYVDKILRGAKPADLPVQQPTEFEFTVNVRAANALGLTIPPDVPAQVTEWVQ